MNQLASDWYVRSELHCTYVGDEPVSQDCWAMYPLLPPPENQKSDLESQQYLGWAM